LVDCHLWSVEEFDFAQSGFLFAVFSRVRQFLKFGNLTNDSTTDVELLSI